MFVLFEHESNNIIIVNKKRLKKVQILLENLQLENNKKYLHKYCEVLIENKLDNQNKFFGRTKYMTPVIVDSDKCKSGEIITVKISSFDKKNLFGFYKTDKVKAA